jgi:putative DNA primase/helicase
MTAADVREAMQYYSQAAQPPAAVQGRTAWALAERGLRVFPCGKPQDPKAPRGCPNGLNNATATLGRERQQAVGCDGTVRTINAGVGYWWGRGRPSVGLPCGANGFTVLDDDGGLAEQFPGLPATFTVRSPSGGRHLYFEGTCVSAAGDGFDVKSRGGYVLAPGQAGYTVERDVPPAPLPEKVREWADAHASGKSLEMAAPLQELPEFYGPADPRAAERLNEACASIQAAEAGDSRNGRRQTAYRAGCYVGRHAGLGWIDARKAERTLRDAALEAFDFGGDDWHDFCRSLANGLRTGYREVERQGVILPEVAAANRRASARRSPTGAVHVHDHMRGDSVTGQTSRQRYPHWQKVNRFGPFAGQSVTLNGYGERTLGWLWWQDRYQRQHPKSKVAKRDSAADPAWNMPSGWASE